MNIDFRNMADSELHETYITIKNALGEYGHTENIVNAYISCATEIACRYFESKGLYNRKVRDELIESINRGEW